MSEWDITNFWTQAALVAIFLKVVLPIVGFWIAWRIIDGRPVLRPLGRLVGWLTVLAGVGWLFFR